MKKEIRNLFSQILTQIYPENVDVLLSEITHLLKPITVSRKEVSQEDIILVTYPDHIYEEGIPTLQTLRSVIQNDFSFINTVHILPFHPFSSDGGFAVSDYSKINNIYGDWNDIEKLAHSKKIMCDVVLNHVSQKHPWFIKCQKGDLFYKRFFHVFDSIPYKPDVFRARTTPLFTPVLIEGKQKYVWTTFSADQVDVNFQNHEVLIHYLRIIRNYSIHSISLFRLDAIAYIIKEKTGVHQEKTFLILELLHLFIKELHPTNMVIPEVNFSLENNNRYLQKSDAIYHFELASLLLYSFYNQDSSIISRWLFTNPQPKGKIHLQFTTTHDGIAVLGLKKILSQNAFESFIKQVQQQTGVVSYKAIGKTKTPYEINGLFSTIIGNAKSFISCKLITLALAGIPLFYLPDFFSLSNWTQGYEDTHQPRNLSRQKFSLRQYELIREFMSEPLKHISHAAHIRTHEPLFHPNVPQKIMEQTKELIIIKRFTDDEELYAITNVTKKKQTYQLHKKSVNILTHETFTDVVTIKPFETVWCKIK